MSGVRKPVTNPNLRFAALEKRVKDLETIRGQGSSQLTVLHPKILLVTVGGALNQYGIISPPWFPTFGATIGISRLQVGIPGTGLVQVDFLRNGATIYTTKPTIAAGSPVGAIQAPNVTAWDSGDRLEVQILQDGGASDLLFEMEYTRTTII